MTIPSLIGIGLLILPAAFFLGNLVTAYRTEGGAIGQVPVMAVAVAVPAAGAFELALLDSATDWPGWPGWIYAVLWLAATPAAWWITGYTGKLGRRKAARASPASPPTAPE